MTRDETRAQGAKRQGKTNFDVITESPEAFAEFKIKSSFCPPIEKCEKNCNECWVAYLNQPAEGEKQDG